MFIKAYLLSYDGIEIKWSLYLIILFHYTLFASSDAISNIHNNHDK